MNYVHSSSEVCTYCSEDFSYMAHNGTVITDYQAITGCTEREREREREREGKGKGERECLSEGKIKLERERESTCMCV